MPHVLTLVAALAMATGLASCGGGEVPRPSPPVTASPTTVSPSPEPTPSPTDEPSPTPTQEPSIHLPRDAPTTFGDDLPADALPLEVLVPPGAVVTSSHAQKETDGGHTTITLAWVRGEDPFAAEHGLVMWQRFDERPAWRVVYALTDPPRRGVLGIRVDQGDVTGDGVDDVLSFEDVGGSGGCGTWRLVVAGPGSASEVWRRRGCDTLVQLARRGIEVREAVFEPGDAHCCPSAYRITRLAWDGDALTEVRSTLSPAG